MTFSPLPFITRASRAATAPVYSWFASIRRSRAALSQATARAKFDTRKWTPELLRQLEWRRFEELCAAYYQALGFNTRIDGIGADGGVDIVLNMPPSETIVSVARCRSWDAYRVGIKAVRELRSSATSAKIAEAVLLTSGRFTQEALDLAGKEKVEMIDGGSLLKKINALPADKSLALLKFATTGDFLTPTCPRCSIKMISRKSTKGGRPFWGCRNYPQCKQTIFASAPMAP